MIEASLLQPVRWGWQTFRTDASSGTYIYWLTFWWWVLSILSLDSPDNLVVHKLFFVRFFLLWLHMSTPNNEKYNYLEKDTQHCIILSLTLNCEMLINLVKHNTMYHKWNKAIRVPLDTIHKQGIVWQMYSTRYLTQLTRPNCRKE
jgi:hypothetical protein